jgi:glycosyltransferase involved in cell wall biosynthesis
MKIVVWQAALTDHQAYTFIELGRLCSEEIKFIVGKKIIPERIQQGWHATEIDDLVIYQLPRSGWLRQGMKLINDTNENTHIFDSMLGDKRIFFLMIYAQIMGLKTILIMEPYADKLISYFGDNLIWKDRIKFFLRPLVYQILGKLLASRTQAIFAISSKASCQLKAIGFHQDRIFPFGYFVPVGKGVKKTQDTAEQKTTLQILFVGSLIARKGLISLLGAVRKAQNLGANLLLDVYGPGSPRDAMSFGRGINFCGAIPFGKAQEVISSYDLLVLPSLHDGWGVVVNEALLQGVPVIVSDAVGAKTLIEKSGAGAVYPAEDLDALASIFIKLSANPSVLYAWQKSAENFRNEISPKTAAIYMHECISYIFGDEKTRPKSPWYIDSEG